MRRQRSSPSRNDEFSDDQLQRAQAGEAYYYGLDRRPWDKEEPEPKKKRPGPGRPKNSKNKPKPDLDEPFNPLLNMLCPVCVERKGVYFLSKCGHGMVCAKCLSNIKPNCFACFKTASAIEYKAHQK